MTFARLLLPAILVLSSACSSEVRIVPSETEEAGGASGSVGGGAQGGEGGAGGSQVGPRLITVDLDLPRGADPSAVTVLVNAPDGSLRSTTSGSELGEGVFADDGDMISAVYMLPWPEPYVESFRVTGGVEHIYVEDVFVATTTVDPACERQEPMAIEVVLPEGVVHHEITVLDAASHEPMCCGSVGVGAVVSLEVQGCAGQGAFDLWVVAESEDGTIGVQSWQIFQFTPGEAFTLMTELQTPERTAFEVHFSELQSTTRLQGRAAWHLGLDGGYGNSISESANAFDESSTPLTPFTWSPSPVSHPFGRQELQVTAQLDEPEGECRRSRLFQRGPAAGPIDFAVEALADPIVTDDGTLQLGAGERGDSVDGLYFVSASQGEDIRWGVHEDPAALSWALVFPEGASAYETGSPAWNGVWHNDAEATAGYAELHAGPLPWNVTYRSRIRDVFACDE